MTTIAQPHAHEVHLYPVSLSEQLHDPARFERYLSPVETARSNQLKSDRARKCFIAGRGVLRDILGKYLGCEPAEVPIAAGEQGKPYLTGSSERLRFNVSHSGELLLLAVATGRDIGIDLETTDPDKPFAAMARIAFSRPEQEELFSLPASRQAAAFYRQWVRKEACLKACGTGFSVPGTSVEIDSGTPALVNISGSQTSWHLLDIEVPAGFCAALAVEADCSDLTTPFTTRIPYP